MKNHREDLGRPGVFPFTRGIYPEMYRRRLWTIRQYAGFGSAEQANRRFHYLLSQGITGLSVAFDLPTQLGYDSDHPLAEGEVGRTGVAVSSLADMGPLFEGIRLSEVSTSMTINATAPILLAFYVLAARNQGADLRTLAGTVQNDILKEYVARGAYIFPPRPSLRLATDLIAWANRELPEWNPISICGYHIREAGSTAVQEVAFTLSNGIACVQAAVEAGVHPDSFAPRLSFFFNAHNGFLEEIAKFRAARRLWAHIMRDRFGARDPRSMTLRFHAQTGGSTLTAQQPDVNVVRTAIQALSAVLGGAQSIHTNSRDEALSLPTEASARLALRTQQILAHETGITNTVDPVGGSYEIERLTREIEAGVKAYLDQIDSMGGPMAALESGFFQAEIQNAAYRYQQRVESGEEKLLGVNCFLLQEERKWEPFHPDPSSEAKQVERLRQVRASRETSAWQRSLKKLERAARGAENLMPPILDAAAAYATVGEISDTLRTVFGEYKGDRL